MKSVLAPNTNLEARILADRWALRPRPVLKWMKARGFADIGDLRVFSTDWKESMDLALGDFWEFHGPEKILLHVENIQPQYLEALAIT